jgi:hypothetical protein
MKTRKPRAAVEPPTPSPGTGPPGKMPVPARQVLQTPRPQPELTVSRPDDAYEREAEQVADHVLRLSNPASPMHRGPPGPSSSTASVTQSRLSPSIRRSPSLQLDQPGLTPPWLLGDPDAPEIDWFEMSRPFYDRGVGHLLYLDPYLADSIERVWRYNFEFLRMLGLGEETTVSATNFLTPFAIDHALRYDHPTRPELFEREANISTYAGNVTVMQFDIGRLPSTVRFPWLEFFGVDQPNPYRTVRRQPRGPGAPLVARRSAGRDPVPTSDGAPLPASVRGFFEPRFGRDFARVRIHTGREADDLARRYDATAFTYGHDIIFSHGSWQPSSTTGCRLLAHELAHVAQHDAGRPGSPAVSRQERPSPEEAKRTAEIRDRLAAGGELTEEDIEFVRRYASRQIVQQLVGPLLANPPARAPNLEGGPQQGLSLLMYLRANAPLQNTTLRFRGSLRLELTGMVGAVAGSFEGTATCEVDVVTDVSKRTITLTLSPPTEDNRMSAIIRQLFFHNARPYSLDFDVGEVMLRAVQSLGALNLRGLVIAGPDARVDGPIVLRHEAVPDGVALHVSVVPSARRTPVEDTEFDVPSDHWTLTPNPRLFTTTGYRYDGFGHALTVDVGADVPLFFDTSLPVVYGGLGVRGSYATSGSGRVGGTAFVGVNLDPLDLQLGWGIGAAFLPEPVETENGPARVLIYNEVEGTASYRIISDLELMLSVSLGGGRDFATTGSVRAGAAYRF